VNDIAIVGLGLHDVMSSPRRKFSLQHQTNKLLCDQTFNVVE